MLFSLRQIQKKCRERRKPLYVAFIDLTKAFDLVSRDGLFKVLKKVGCPSGLLGIIKSFHNGMRGVIRFDGSSSQPFDIKCGVKQGCVLAPTLFGIYFAVMLQHAFKFSTEGILLNTRTGGKLFNAARLRAKTKVRRVLIRDLLFADDSALVAHTEEDLQRLIDCFSDSCDAFWMSVSLTKTQIMTQGTDIDRPTYITVKGSQLEVVHTFKYLGSNVSDGLDMGLEVNRRMALAASVFARLIDRVWENGKLTIETKMSVYKACVLSVLLFGSEAWTVYARQEEKLNCFQLKHLRKILGVKWNDFITNADILQRADMPSMLTFLRQHRLRWLGHVHRMPDGRIPKDLLYGELAEGKRAIGRPMLRFRDVCKRDMMALDIDVSTWEELAEDRAGWRRELQLGLGRGEEKLKQAAADKRRKRKEKEQMGNVQLQGPSQHVCSLCGRDCHSRIGLYSHRRKCGGNRAQQ